MFTGLVARSLNFRFEGGNQPRAKKDFLIGNFN